jgi:CDP-diacylglycerol---serine O-phosphatidyltransferase
VPDPPPGQRRLSILRSYTPADLLTLGNASCGALTIFACLSYIDDARSPQIEAAFVLPIVALVLDFFDGYVARLNPKRQSLLGADLDSLADIVSFGVAPAVLGYTLGLRGLGDVLCLTYFVCCGISRLARFNVTSSSLTDLATGKVRYFEGTPIPTSILLVLLMAALFYLGMTGANFPGGHVDLLGRGFHPISLLFVVSGSLMISTIKVPKP